jgi:hypothetical protein
MRKRSTLHECPKYPPPIKLSFSSIQKIRQQTYIYSKQKKPPSNPTASAHTKNNAPAG